ncbi:hypothetical protein TNCV_4222501 [Trichonephila clavipes]|nr:hypothetical protein TNCV_4222501 [Trichonephila clavipes]
MIVRPKNISTLLDNFHWKKKQKGGKKKREKEYTPCFSTLKGGSQQFPHYALWQGLLQEGPLSGLKWFQGARPGLTRGAENKRKDRENGYPTGGPGFDATKYPQSAHGVRAREISGPKSLVGGRSGNHGCRGLENIFLSPPVPCLNCGEEDRGSNLSQTMATFIPSLREGQNNNHQPILPNEKMSSFRKMLPNIIIAITRIVLEYAWKCFSLLATCRKIW